MNYPKLKQKYAPLQFQSGVHRAHRQAALFVERECAHLQLTGPEAHLLGYVQSHDGCPLSELVRVFGIKRSTLTSILDRFERRGLLARELSARDRRSFLVRVTPAGRRIADGARQVALELERSIASRIAPDDVAAFERVLDAFAQATGVTVRPAGSKSSEGGSRRTGRRRSPDHRSPRKEHP